MGGDVECLFTKVKGKNEKVFNFEGLRIEFHEHFAKRKSISSLYRDEFVYSELLNYMFI